MRPNQLTRQLNLLTCYWIFPAVTAIITAFLILEPSWISFSLFIFSVCRLFFLKKKKVIKLSIFFSVLSVIVSFRQVNQPIYFDEKNEQTGTLWILPDHYQIDGDVLQIEGLFSIGNGAKQKVRATYRFSSKSEKNTWEKNQDYLKLSIQTKVKTPIGQTNLSGFDFKNYLKYKGIHQILTIENVHSIKKITPKLTDVFCHIHILRKRISNHCKEFFHKNTRFYISTFLLGIQEESFFEQKEAINNLGIVYLFGLSGLHIHSLLRYFRYIFLRVGVTKEQLKWIQILFSFFYAVFVDFSTNVVRILIQSTLKMFSHTERFQVSSLDCWAIAALVNLLFQPYILFTLKGQFSYGLSLILLFSRPLIEPFKGALFRKLTYSFFAHVATVPFLVHSFYEWSFLSSFFSVLFHPVVEKIILPVTYSIFLISFFIKHQLLAEVAEKCFTGLHYIVQWLSQFNCLKLTIGYMPLIGSFSLIVLLLYFLDYLYQRSRKTIGVGLLIILFFFQKYANPFGMVAFIDVGQGDIIFIQAPFHRETILIDTGGSLQFGKKEAWATQEKQRGNASYNVIPFLKSKGVTHLDKVLISHGDSDHCGNLVEINKSIPIRSVYYPAGTEKKPVFNALLQELKKSGTRCYSILADSIISGDVTLQMIAPHESGEGENEDSMVLYTKIAGKRFLFLGDLEKDGEQLIMQRYPNLEVDVLKIGHHGSKTSSDPAFIKQLNVQEGIISCGRNNRYNHPHEETLRTLLTTTSKIYRTDEQGMIYYQWSPFSSMSTPKIVLEQDSQPY